MSDDIPFAHPFPWTDEFDRNAMRLLRKRKFVGSGLALLRKESLGCETKLGNAARDIFMNIFHQHGIELDGEIESDGHKFEGIGLSRRSLQLTPLSRKTRLENQTQHEAALATEPEKKSIFFELLKVITDSSSATISTRRILKKVCVLLQPGSLPGFMDSKDVVLAALHFLSARVEIKSDRVLRLPLIRPLQTYGDLEKRNFEKVGDWKLEDIEEKLSRIEEIFLSSPASWKWQKRESLSLRLPQADEESFFMKGTVPFCATAKKPKGESFKKRKAPLKTTNGGGEENREA